MMANKLKLSLSKRRFLQLLGGAGVSAAACAAYGFGVEPNSIIVKREELKVSELPTAFEGKTIVQITDIHFEKDQDAELIEKLVKEVNGLEPDFILYTGDYITKDMHHFSELMSYLAKISPQLASAAIPGNHDVWYGGESIIRTSFEKLGMSYLRNKLTRISIGGESIFLNGLDSVWGGKPDILKAFSEVKKDEVGLTLMHEPDYFDEISMLRDSVTQFSGHTHGGQCRIPLVGYAPVKVKFGQNYIQGRYEKNSKQQVYVSSGVGTVGMRVRFACPPEIVLFTMKRA